MLKELHCAQRSQALQLATDVHSTLFLRSSRPRVLQPNPRVCTLTCIHLLNARCCSIHSRMFLRNTKTLLHAHKNDLSLLPLPPINFATSHPRNMTLTSHTCDFCHTSKSDASSLVLTRRRDRSLQHHLLLQPAVRPCIHHKRICRQARSPPRHGCCGGSQKGQTLQRLWQS
jgi:hypothetical protein